MLVPEVRTQDLRTIIYQKIVDEWGYVGNRFRHLANLLGHLNLTAMLNHYTDDNERTVRLLAGPNGYAIYKMLLARLDNG